ncbi:MAG: TGS domain-containing protein, partial [Rhodospirillales bacterium]
MVAITLPDGSVKEFDRPVSGAELASEIGPGLAKAALAVRIDGEVLDLSRLIEADCAAAILTAKDEEALELIRHDAAHVMAEAVKELYPETQVTIGPNIENGFFYDFSRPEPFTPDDMEKIEARMHEIVGRAEEVSREVWDRDKAIGYFQDKGELYKAEIIRD